MIYPIDTAFEESSPSTIFPSFSGQTFAREEKIAPILHPRERTLCYIWGKRYKRRTSLIKYNSVLLNLIAIIPIRLFLNVG